MRRQYAEDGSRTLTESFFGTLKKELVRHKDNQTRAEAGQSIFEDIEVFYNRVRKHSALGDKSPIQFLQAQNLHPLSTIRREVH